MGINTIGYYDKLIIHPGETLKEVMDDNNISQEELANRTGVTPKHVSTVVNGQKDISSSFAHKLSYVFNNIPESFWNNLQSIYNEEINNYEDINNISANEKKIVKEMNELYEYAVEKELIKSSEDISHKIIDIRHLLSISNVESIDKFYLNNTSFRLSNIKSYNKYSIFAFNQICEKICDKEEIENDFDIDKLNERLNDIKSIMFNDYILIGPKLKKVFKECGIVFNIVKSFKGVPVQGFIKKKYNKVYLCMTLRQSYADIFWFTLFHEIGHLINDNIKSSYIDLYIENNQDENEIQADLFASDYLINDIDFADFIMNKDYTYKSVLKFADDHNVKDFIVIGRLEKVLNDYSILNKYRIKYM